MSILTFIMYQALRLHIGQCAVQVLRKSIKKWVSNCSLKFWSQNFEKCGRARSHEKYNKWILCWLYIWVENVGSSFLPSWGMTILNWITPIWRVSLEASSLFVTIHPYFVLLLISFTSSSYHFSSFLSKQTFSHHLLVATKISGSQPPITYWNSLHYSTTSIATGHCC